MWMDMVRILSALLLPPVAIFRERGFGRGFWLSLLLTAMGFFPGVFHALWVVADIEDQALSRRSNRNLSAAGP
jgi:uncharacterized membrane protein YqaE (UPF0057 family)